MTVLGRIFHTGCERTTNGEQALGGLAVGTAVGAMLTAAAMGFMIFPPAVIIAFPGALAGWAGGLFLIATPGWWLLHALGARCQQAAMIYGGGLTYVVVLGWAWSQDPATFEPRVLLSPPLLVLTAIGVIVAWVVAKIAYAPAKAS